MVDVCIREVRTLSYILHPPMLDEAGLEDAIRHYVSGFAERAGIQVKLEISAELRKIGSGGRNGTVSRHAGELDKHLVQAVKDLASDKISLTPKGSAMVLEGFLKGGESKQAEDGHPRATPREIEIIRQLAAGKTNKEIAAQLGITLWTVETHRGRIMMKMGLHPLTQLIHDVIRDKIITTQDF